MSSSIRQSTFHMTAAQRDMKLSDHHPFELERVGTSPLTPMHVINDSTPACSRRITETLTNTFPAISIEWRRFRGGVFMLLLMWTILNMAASIANHFHYKNHQPHPSEQVVLEEGKLRETERSHNQSNINNTAKTLGFKLFPAIFTNNETEVERLLEMGADANVRTDVSSMTPLHFSTHPNRDVRLKVIKLLIENGADVHAMDGTNHTFLHYLIDSCNFHTYTHLGLLKDVAQLLISKNHTRLFNTPGNFSLEFQTRFRYSCRMTTPFQLAVKNLEIPMTTLRLLKNNGVDFNAVNSRGDSTLFYALIGKRTPKMITYLVELGADWRHLNNAKENVLHLAVLFGGVDELKYFLGLGLNINAVYRLGDTPLHVAVYYSTIDVLGKAKILIENGANATIINGHGKIPLDDALKRNDLVDKNKLVKLLESGQSNA